MPAIFIPRPDPYTAALNELIGVKQVDRYNSQVIAAQKHKQHQKLAAEGIGAAIATVATLGLAAPALGLAGAAATAGTAAGAGGAAAAGGAVGASSGAALGGLTAGEALSAGLLGDTAATGLGAAAGLGTASTIAPAIAGTAEVAGLFGTGGTLSTLGALTLGSQAASLGAQVGGGLVNGDIAGPLAAVGGFAGNLLQAQQNQRLFGYNASPQERAAIVHHAISMGADIGAMQQIALHGGPSITHQVGALTGYNNDMNHLEQTLRDQNIPMTGPDFQALAQRFPGGRPALFQAYKQQQQQQAIAQHTAEVQNDAVVRGNIARQNSYAETIAKSDGNLTWGYQPGDEAQVRQIIAEQSSLPMHLQNGEITPAQFAQLNQQYAQKLGAIERVPVPKQQNAMIPPELGGGELPIGQTAMRKGIILRGARTAQGAPQVEKVGDTPYFEYVDKDGNTKGFNGTAVDIPDPDNPGKTVRYIDNKWKPDREPTPKEDPNIKMAHQIFETMTKGNILGQAPSAKTVESGMETVKQAAADFAAKNQPAESNIDKVFNDSIKTRLNDISTRQSKGENVQSDLEAIAAQFEKKGFSNVDPKLRAQFEGMIRANSP